jgi:predicted ATPase
VHLPDDLVTRGLSADAVRSQLVRILRSSTFSNAPTLSRLLQHLVECTLQGTAAHHLKEYSLGVEVFDRGDSFDPRTDTIVRVQARRLRFKLNDYYHAQGQFDPVVIEVPTGRYAAVFSARPTEHAAQYEPVVLRTLHEAHLRMVGECIESGRHTLPAARTALIGRQREIAALTRLLRDRAVRLVTLTGAGGSGKTRLALQAAEKVADAFPGGVLMLPLAPLADGGAAATALAQMVGLRHTGGKPVREALRAYVRHGITTPTLLVLDNFEHVIEAAPVVGDLLEASTRVKVLVTSRSVLHLYGEREYPVPPLAVPDPSCNVRELKRNPAIRLFIQRAESANPAFKLTDANASTIAMICRRLDGLPLAIELAAARIKVFPPDAMLPRLANSLEFLSGGPSDVPARHQRLRNTIDWSYTLLTKPEQRLFRRLAVFVGGCTLEGAEAVCNPHRDLELDVVDGMASLVDKSLVHQVEPVGTEARFNMLATVREYALEGLAASGDDVPTKRALAAYCMVLAAEGNLLQTVTEREAWLARCDVELDNFRVTLDWLVASGHAAWALRLGLALFGFWERRELLEEGRQRLQAIVNLRGDATPTSAWARAVAYTAALCDTLGDYDSGRALHQQALDVFRALGDKRGEAAQMNGLAAHHRFKGSHSAARSYSERALELCRELGNQPEIAAALSNLAGVISHEADHARARALLDEARSIFQSIGDESGLVWSINHLGDVARQSADPAEARRLYTDALDGFARLGDPWGVARSSADLANVSGEMGDYAVAHELFRQALTVFAAIDHKRGIARVLEDVALVAQRQQQWDRTLTLVGAAAAIRLAFGAAPRAAEQARLDHSVAPAWQSRAHGDARASWDAGQRMSVNEAIRYAVG